MYEDVKTLKIFPKRCKKRDSFTISLIGGKIINLPKKIERIKLGKKGKGLMLAVKAVKMKRVNNLNSLIFLKFAPQRLLR